MATKKTTAKKTTAKKTTAKKRAKKVKPIPTGYATVTPMLNQSDAAATITFCKKAFGAKLRSKMAGPGGKLMHAEIQIGTSIVMLGDAVREPPRVSSLMLYVEDVDKTVAKAVKAGAQVMVPVQDQFWGDRFGRITDPQGNLWGIATHVEDVAPAEMSKRARAFAKKMSEG